MELLLVREAFSRSRRDLFAPGVQILFQRFGVAGELAAQIFYLAA